MVCLVRHRKSSLPLIFLACIVLASGVSAATIASDETNKSPMSRPVVRENAPTNSKAEIGQLLQKHRADYLKGDADAWASAYAADAVFTGRKVLDGRQAIRDYFAAVFKKYPTRSISVSETQIRVYNDGPNATAVLNVADKGDRVDPAGGKVVLVVRESLVFVKTNSKWIIVDHHASPDPWPTTP